MADGARRLAALPDPEVALDALRESHEPLTVGQLLRRLGLPPNLKIRLRRLLHEQAVSGAFRDAALLGKLRGEPDLPLLADVIVTGRDIHGAPVGRIAPSEPLGLLAVEAGALPIVFLHKEQPHEPLLLAGQSVLARLRSVGRYRYEGRILQRKSNEVDGLSPACQDDPVAVIDALLARYGLSDSFPDDVMREAACLSAPVDDGTRLDVRDIPFVTIDGANARDFDDAIWAAPDGDGFRLLVAIADVAHYVTPDSALDREARRRGNSIYLPDRVIPMLPPFLSEELCSLKPNEDRYCVLFDLRINQHGQQTGSPNIRRALMRSRARLTYEQVQAMRDGEGALPAGFDEEWLDGLYAAHRLLSAERVRRGCLPAGEEVVTQEIHCDPDTKTVQIVEARPYESQKLIESFMIAAGEAASRTLQERGARALFRRHDSVDGSSATLRVPAVYSVLAGRHAGLGLDVYAHVTSPIRRYADLICHRALLEEKAETSLSLAELPAHLSVTEAVATEISGTARERLLLLWLNSHRTKVFEGHVAAVTRFGVQVTLTDTGTTGLLSFTEPAERKPHVDSSRGDEACSGAEASSQTIPADFFPRKGSRVHVRVIGFQADGSGCLFRLAAGPA